MTQTTFVRLEEADLAAMARRLGQPMTDEGAKAWFQHDVAELLQEVVALRQERHAAVASFREHAPLSDVPDSLPLIAAAWREQVTGLWEKAQVKKLRAEIAQAKLEVSDLTADLAVSHVAIRDLAGVRDELQAQLDAAARAYEQQAAERQIEHDTHTAHLKDRDDAQAQLESTIKAYDAKLEELRKQRTTYVERIEELEAQVSTLMDEQANEQQRVSAMVKAVEEAYTSHAQKAKNLLLEAQTALGT